ncbi:MAG: hypothetical protein AAF585_28935, partial [Verrucomicrobiota bacterium]
NVGLVDANGYLEDAHKRAAELAGDENLPLVPYQEDYGLFGALGMVKASQAALQNAGQPVKIEVQVPESILPPLKPGMVYLLPRHYAP